MGLQRLYLPVTTTDLAALLRDGTLPAGRPAYGVTPAFAAATPRADEEEREYLAFLDAAAAAREHNRVIVLAVDLPDGEVRWSGPGTAVALPRPLLHREGVSLHVGEEDGPDADLLWYDITEAEVVLDLLD